MCVCASSRSWEVSRGQEGGLEFTEDRFLLRSAWVALGSFRSSSVQLVGQAPCWIQTRLRFEDWHQLFAADLWRALGVHCGNAEKLVDMELRWSPAAGRLLVSARFQLCGSAAADVRELIKSAWCFDSFSGSGLAWLGRICEDPATATLLARRHPWSLCSGNIDENPQKFAAGCCPTEETAKKVWTLMKMEFPRAALKAGLEGTREASCGAIITEQTRASGSIMTRMHRTCGDATMRDRAFAFQTRPLLVPSEFQRKAQMLQDRLQRLLKRNQNKLGVRQAWAT